MQEELLRIEREFERAILTNDADHIAGFLTGDWVLIGPDGEIIERSRFLDVVRSGALKHHAMSSDDVRVRVFGHAAVVTALTRSAGSFLGQEYSSVERATDFFVRQDNRWVCALTHLTRYKQP